MDFEVDPVVREVAALAAEVLARPRRTWRDAWTGLACADLLGLAVPESVGGTGLGADAVFAVLTEVGKAGAELPALASLGLGLLPLLAEDHLAEARPDVLREIAAGALIVGAWNEPGAPFTASPACIAEPDGDDFLLTGSKVAVPYAADASSLLIPTDAGVFLVDPNTVGMSLVATPTSAGTPEFALRLDRVRVPASARLELDVAVALRYTLAAVGATIDGLIAGATALTAEHIGSRVQFGKPLATFQAVAQQIADVYVVARTTHLAAVSAAWRLTTGLDADSDLDVLAYWTAAEVPAAMRTLHHLHGGVGVDVTYPMHRYSSQVKDAVRLLGGADFHLERLGARACTSN